MYTILMNENKHLLATKTTTIRQGETGVDKFRFLVPKQRKGMDLSKFTVLLTYVDAGNVAHPEILQLEDDLYKEHLSYLLPVNTKITRFAGEIRLSLTFLNINMDKGVQEEVFHTSEWSVMIEPKTDYFAYVPDEFLGTLDQRILKTDAQIKALDKLYGSKADDFVFDKSDNSLQLTSDGEPIGTKQTISAACDENGVPVVEFSVSENPDVGEGDEYSDVVEF